MLLTSWSKFSTNQKHYPDLGSYVSSVWNFYTSFSDVILQGKEVVMSQNVGCFIMLYRFLIQMILLVHLDRQGEGESNFPAENDATFLHWQLSVSAEKCNSFQFSPPINPTPGTKMFSIQDEAGPGHSKFRRCYRGQTGWFMVWVKYTGKQNSGW